MTDRGNKRSAALGLALLQHVSKMSGSYVSAGNRAAGLRSGARPAKGNGNYSNPYLDRGERSTAASSLLCNLRIGKSVIALHCIP